MIDRVKLRVRHQLKDCLLGAFKNQVGFATSIPRKTPSRRAKFILLPHFPGGKYTSEHHLKAYRIQGFQTPSKTHQRSFKLSKSNVLTTVPFFLLLGLDSSWQTTELPFRTWHAAVLISQNEFRDSEEIMSNMSNMNSCSCHFMSHLFYETASPHGVVPWPNYQRSDPTRISGHSF